MYCVTHIGHYNSLMTTNGRTNHMTFNVMLTHKAKQFL